MGFTTIFKVLHVKVFTEVSKCRTPGFSLHFIWLTNYFRLVSTLFADLMKETCCSSKNFKSILKTVKHRTSSEWCSPQSTPVQKICRSVIKR